MIDKLLITVFIMLSIFLLPGFLYSARADANKSAVSKDEALARQEAMLAGKKIDAEEIRANAETEEMRLKAEQELAESLKQAEEDLQAINEDLQKEQFPQPDSRIEEPEEK